MTPHRDPGPPPSGSGPAPGDRETPERPRPWTDPAAGLPRRPGARRGPPPWWPEGEPWPPPRGKGGHNRGRFIRRIVFALGAIWLFTLFMGFIFGRFAPQQPSREYDGGPPGIVFILFLILIAIFGHRFLRRTAAPIGDMMSAAGRVADGDYTARIEPKGNGEIRELAESFNKMTERLQANEKLRRNLLADVAHELRTPLSVIQGNVEGMLDGVYPRDDSHLLPILDQTAIMSRLLDDLRTFSLVEAGVFKLHREPTDIEELVLDLVAAYQPRARQAGVTLIGEVSPMAEAEVDPVRLRQVLENLLTNALRYTPEGGTIRLIANSDGRAVFFTVADSGVGIPPEHLPHLFERFWKSADSGGSGLGLAIARTLVEAHGGQIHAESTPGQGTTLRLQIPVSEQQSVWV